MSQFKHYLDTRVTGKRVMVLSALSIAFLGLFFGLAFSDIPTNTLLDTHFNFSAVQVHTVLGSYSLTMMSHYVRVEIIDLVGMVLVCMTQSSIIVYVCRRWAWAQLASAVPLGAMTF